MLILTLIIATLGKDPVHAPGDMDVENSIQSFGTELPDDSTLLCNTAEVHSMIAESIYTTYVTANTLIVSSIIATNTDLLISGKLKITGSISYTSELQVSMDQHKNFIMAPISFLQLPYKQWREVNIFLVEGQKVKIEELPEHSYVMVKGNCHCFEGTVMMKANNDVEWMENCLGTNHFASVISHSGEVLELEFFGSEEIDPILLFIK